MRTEWIKKFDIDGYRYVVFYNRYSHEISFWIDVKESVKKPPLPDEHGFSFFDEPPLAIYSRVTLEHPFKLKKEILSFVEEVIEKESPHYFFFNGFFEDKERIIVYNKLAERLSDKYNYFYHLESPNKESLFFSFKFFKV